eukprot:Gb_23460 [translate_table: standard]
MEETNNTRNRHHSPPCCMVTSEPKMGSKRRILHLGSFHKQLETTPNQQRPQTLKRVARTKEQINFNQTNKTFKS